MVNYKLVKKTPEKLGSNEFVIERPNFLEEIDSTRGRRGTTNLTTASYLRDVFMAITDKYDNTINPYKLILSKYVGLSYENDKDISDIVLKIIDDHRLPLVEKAVEYKIKSRPLGTELIYYISDDTNGVSAFIKMGINALQQEKKKTEVKE